MNDVFDFAWLLDCQVFLYEGHVEQAGQLFWMQGGITFLFSPLTQPQTLQEWWVPFEREKVKIDREKSIYKASSSRCRPGKSERNPSAQTDAR